MYMKVKLVGRTGSDDFPGTALSVPIVMNGTKPDIEAIEGSGAQAAYYDPALMNPADLDKLKQHNITLIPIGGDNLDEFVRSVYAAAAMSGAETNTNEYVQNYIYGKLASSTVPGSPTVAFILPGQGSEHMIAGTNSFQADILRRLGSKPVGPDAKIFVPMNVEQLIKDEPQVILVAGDPSLIVKDPRLAGLKAVKQNRVYGMRQDIALREGARVPDFIQAAGEALNLAVKSQ